MKGELILAGFALVLLGTLLIFAGMLAGAKEGAEVKGGGVILIGPFPIAFGTDAESLKTVLLLALAIIIVVYFLFYRGQILK